MRKKNTDELKSELSEASSLHTFLEENDASFESVAFTELLEEMIVRKHLKKSVLAKRAGMSEVYLHQIIAGRRNPSRERVICLCIGMQASLEESQALLCRSGLATLYAKNRRDAIIMYGITHKLDLFEVNDRLFEAREDILF